MIFSGLPNDPIAQPSSGHVDTQMDVIKALDNDGILVELLRSDKPTNSDQGDKLSDQGDGLSDQSDGLSDQSDETSSAQEFDGAKKTVQELRQLCKTNGLNIGGRKQEIVLRLEKYIATGGTLKN